MKKALKLFGIIALVAVIGFSMVSCKDDDDGGGLPAPLLTATAISSTEIYISWTAVPGAAGYNVYAGTSSIALQLLGTRTGTSSSMYNATPNTTYYFQVAAYASNGIEGARSNVASATTLGGTQTPNLSLNGTWENENGRRVTISGSTGYISALGSSYKVVWQDAINKGYITVGTTYFRNLTSTGTYTWSGQLLEVQYNTSSPNVAIGTGWINCTITMSSNGQTFAVAVVYSGTTLTETWTRQ